MKSVFGRLAGLVALASMPAVAAVPSPLGCLIEPFQSAEVGSPVVGVIEAIQVERGDRVTRGQPLATLRADVERMSMAVAQSRANAVGELKAARANAELARQKLARAEDLARQQFISGQALEQARAEAVVAENRLAQAEEQRGIYASEQRLARAQLELRTIRSPSNGVVAERYVSVGERVEEKPMFRVAEDDPLRVEVVLPVSVFPLVKKGMRVTVLPELPGATPREARIIIVDRIVEGASNTFRVRLELPNPDRSLPAGLRCKAELSDVEIALHRAAATPLRPTAARASAAPPPHAASPAPAVPSIAPSAQGALALRLSPQLGAVPNTRP
ncbi:MAG TPA: efflux RND transporter periplasmic adaptor subunit [Ramlibacter sp.]|uniref:efflux RND transporter periplasmic adaptor subunit n=1 Tax=Ramlibacter sp. TaxID=1917967 RepID=UPI002B5D0681|nr:efflux RND transporter periplasmic adaptor subunit [Ramlibacter sp.]HVZ46413.1 efflux RND transporter periplasmic adaptor subunit [Ramlibacter sp.]